MTKVKKIKKTFVRFETSTDQQLGIISIALKNQLWVKDTEKLSVAFSHAWLVLSVAFSHAWLVLVEFI